MQNQRFHNVFLVSSGVDKSKNGSLADTGGPPGVVEQKFIGCIFLEAFKFTPMFNHFFQRCLIRNPKQRISVSELLVHPYVHIQTNMQTGTERLLQI